MIFKNRSKHSFTQIDNFVVQKESDISWRALGLLTYLVSLPPDWSISIERLGKIRAEGRDAVRTAMNELVIAGYVVKRGRKKMPDGKLGEFLYDVSDIKWSFQNDDNTSTPRNPEGEQPKSDDPAQEDASNIWSKADAGGINDEESFTENNGPSDTLSAEADYQYNDVPVGTEDPPLDSHSLEFCSDSEPAAENPRQGEPAQDNPTAYKEGEESNNKRKSINNLSTREKSRSDTDLPESPPDSQSSSNPGDITQLGDAAFQKFWKKWTDKIKTYPERYDERSQTMRRPSEGTKAKAKENYSSLLKNKLCGQLITPELIDKAARSYFKHMPDDGFGVANCSSWLKVENLEQFLEEIGASPAAEEDLVDQSSAEDFGFDTLRTPSKILPRPEPIFDAWDWLDISDQSLQFKRLTFEQQMEILRLQGIRMGDWPVDEIDDLSEREKLLHPEFQPKTKDKDHSDDFEWLCDEPCPF